MNGLIQGKDAVLSFNKNGWAPFVCATDLTITMTSDELPIRTVKDGHWKKVAYQNASYEISLSGILKFDDDDHWSGWDMIDNWLNFTDVEFRITFTDQEGVNVRSLQGTAMVKSSTVGISAGEVVKNDFDLSGNGALMMFDGLVPCDSSITAITVNGQTAADGIVHVTYSFSGAPYQVKYRIDGTGDYVFELTDSTLDIPGLSVGTHAIEIIPICQNNYDGDGMVQPFVVTQSLTCGSGVTSINQTSTTIFPVFSGSPAFYNYKIDAGGYVRIPAHQGIPIGVLQPGAHTLNITPICSNGVAGTPGTFSFTKTGSAGIARLGYSFSNAIGGQGALQIYIDGVLTVNSTTGTGTLFLMPGKVVRVVLKTNALSGTGRHMDLKTDDVTGSTTLNHQTGTTPATLTYTFTQTGGNKQVTASIT